MLPRLPRRWLAALTHAPERLGTDAEGPPAVVPAAGVLEGSDDLAGGKLEDADALADALAGEGEAKALASRDRTAATRAFSEATSPRFPTRGTPAKRPGRGEPCPAAWWEDMLRGADAVATSVATCEVEECCRAATSAPAPANPTTAAAAANQALDLPGREGE